MVAYNDLIDAFRQDGDDMSVWASEQDSQMALLRF